jgi:hypothetical protein
MKFAHVSLLGLLLVALGPAPAAHSSWPAVTGAAAIPQLRHAESVELLTRLQADMQAILGLIRKMRGHAAVAASGMLPPPARVLLNMGFQSLVTRVDQIAFSCSSNGIPLLDGSNMSVALQIHPARPQVWNQPLSNCSSLNWELGWQDITSVSNALSALVMCDTALDSVESALRWVRAGKKAIGP